MLEFGQYIEETHPKVWIYFLGLKFSVKGVSGGIV